MEIDSIQKITSILQNIMLFGATFVAAWWAFITFGFKEKTDELLAIARKIFEIHSHIDKSVSTYSSYEIFVSLGTFDEQKLTNFKQVAEARLITLREELNELQELSLRISNIFRILTIGEYQLILIDLTLNGGIDQWRKEEMKEKLRQAKFEILNEIYAEINKYGNFFRKIQVRVSDTIYQVKNLGS